MAPRSESRKSLTSFRPVVTRATLSEDEVVGTEKASKGTRSDGVHSSRLQVDQDSARNVFVGTDLIIIDRNAFELKVVIALVQALAVNAVFI